MPVLNLASVPKRYFGYLALLLWAALTLFLMRQSPYMLDEGGAKALLLDWSIGDQVASSVVTFGAPDLRALLWLPLGFLWPGQIFPAKVIEVLLLAATAAGFFLWRRREGTEEEALLATGLLLIAPISLQQLDMLSPGVGLLGAFIAGAWLDHAYRQSPGRLGGLFFMQLIVCAFSVSLHPAGLAYPASLLWSWYSNPMNRLQQRVFLVSVTITTLVTLIAILGWHDLGPWQNPVTSAAAMIWGPNLLEEGTPSAGDWIVGAFMLSLVLAVCIHQRRLLWRDFAGRSLLLGTLLGAFLCDASWSFLGLALLLYGGLPWLLKPRSALAGRGFMAQRGWVWILLFLLSTVDMRADQAWYMQVRDAVLPEQDQLIKTFADNLNGTRKALEEKNLPMPKIRVASQWPARTMIACRCDTLPLPPAAKDPQAQLALLKGISHLILVPNDNKNLGLVQNLAYLGADIVTESLQPGGAILRVKAPVVTAPKSGH